MLIRCMTVIAALALGAPAGEIIRNPTRRDCPGQLVRLETVPPANPFIVRSDGSPVPHQVERIGDRDWIWVLADFPPQSSRSFEAVPGQSAKAAPRVRLQRQGDLWVLDNGSVALRIPSAADRLVGPIAGIRISSDRWVGRSTWNSSLPLKRFSSQVIGDGTLFAKVRLRYEFDGLAGVNRDQPAFSQIDITLAAGMKHAAIFERHAMGPADCWELAASDGWKPTRGISRPFSAGAGSGKVAGKIEPDRALLPGGLPLCREDLFLRLLSRWNQHYRDGWCFAATDGQDYVGAVAVRASQWVWPHDNAIDAVVKPSGDYAGLRCPTTRGQRLWWLFGPSADPANIDYVARHAFEDLDKLNREMVLAWPGRTGEFSGLNLYSGNQVNPSSSIRGQGKRALADAGKEGDLSVLWRMQLMFHEDAYGSYRNYWSPENPNFFTDFYRVPIAMAMRMRSHPQFERFRKMAEDRFREDMDHSVSLLSGAGQECPGYLHYALENWAQMAPLCRERLGFDPTAWPRYRAAQRFLRRVSQPDGDQRRELPMGDTHPDRSRGGPKLVQVEPAEARTFATEELAGFGALFSHNAGTPRETYLAFKAGPSRGHYHGDQLAFHYCADARAIAVDHHCSYSPRAGQEHMHNRVAFSTKGMPFANMDGFERLIAFKTSPQVDIAIGQVESPRLRAVEKLPPELWHQEYPQHALASPLVYRRTIIFVKAAPRDFFIIRDQYWAPESLRATYCLHVRSDSIRRQGGAVDFGNLTLFCAAPREFQFEPFPWSHDNGGRESTQGARLAIEAASGQFITVLYPGKPPEMEALPDGVRVGEYAVRFNAHPASADIPQGDAPVVTVSTARQSLLSLPAREIDLNRSQGEIGLFVPDAGYPFGPIPDWLIRQRTR